MAIRIAFLFFKNQIQRNLVKTMASRAQAVAAPIWRPAARWMGMHAERSQRGDEAP